MPLFSLSSGLLRVRARAAVVWVLVLLAAEWAVQQEKAPHAAQGAPQAASQAPRLPQPRQPFAYTCELHIRW
jgi:hypothetical protein